MNFEQALVAELNSVSGLPGKCFPLVSPKGTAGTFLVYRKQKMEHVKTLGGFLGKCSANYEIILVAKLYDDLQDLTDAVTDKFKSFLGRSIGTAGPLIENISINHNGDTYAVDAELYRADLAIEIKY